jgi:membrane-bound serine protease (ClpP class)
MKMSRQKNGTRFVLKHLPVLVLAAILSLLLLSVSTRQSYAATPHVDVMSLNSAINPASVRVLNEAIATAQQDGAQALVITINTPGGDINSMKAMEIAELNSPVPIITYVAPSGAMAASAGTFVTLAGQVAAMAPGTTIGAASPVTGSGGDIGSTMKAKIEQMLVADLTNIQQRYHRNVENAIPMVTQAKAYTDQQAYQDGIIDFRASGLADLLAKANDKMVPMPAGMVTLHTQGDSVLNIDQSAFDTLYSLLLDPNVLFVLFIVALIGIFVEISHPGAILPGVVGGIALILFLFGAGSISPNWAGLALMALAFVLLILDTRLSAHGVLTIGALVSLIFGTLLFFNSGEPYQGPQVNMVLVFTMAGLVGLVSLYILTMVVRMRRQPVTTGTEGMIGATVIALTPLVPDGRVSYAGEDWAAVLDNPDTKADPGNELRIVSVEGLTLHVKPTYDSGTSSSPLYSRES